MYGSTYELALTAVRRHIRSGQGVGQAQRLVQRGEGKRPLAPEVLADLLSQVPAPDAPALGLAFVPADDPCGFVGVRAFRLFEAQEVVQRSVEPGGWIRNRRSGLGSGTPHTGQHWSEDGGADLHRLLGG